MTPPYDLFYVCVFELHSIISVAFWSKRRWHFLGIKDGLLVRRFSGFGEEDGFKA